MDGKAGDAASVAAGTDQTGAVVSDPAPAAVPAWVGTAVWRGIWQLIAAVLITAAALWFAGQASDLLRYLILAQLLAFALEPAVYWLHQRRGWRRGRATGLLLVGIPLLFVVLGVGMGAVLADQVDEAAGQLPVWIDNLRRAGADPASNRLRLAVRVRGGPDVHRLRQPPLPLGPRRRDGFQAAPCHA